jgi:hypothetical protein
MCVVKVAKKFGSCEHEMTIACGIDVETQSCKAICDMAYDCCSKTCMAPCHECKRRSRSAGQETAAPVSRKIHRPHKCDRDLLCGHACNEDCKVGHECGVCDQERVKTCIHAHKSHAKCCEVKKPCKSSSHTGHRSNPSDALRYPLRRQRIV